jgi:hypothetical protein
MTGQARYRRWDISVEEIGLTGKLSSAVVLALMALFLLLVIDIDRPLQGTIRESQAPMEQLRAALAARPSSTFDRYKTAPAPAQMRP